MTTITHAVREFNREMKNLANEEGVTTTISAGDTSMTIGPDERRAHGERLIDEYQNATSDEVEHREGEDPDRPDLPWVSPPSEHVFKTEDREFLVADDLAALGAILIDTKPALAGLEGLKISYLWKAKGGASGGKMTLGKCAKTPPLVRAYRESMFTIWLAADHAREFNLSQLQLEALLYHELCHADLEEVENETTGEVTYRPRVLAHDVEMFHSEIGEYGLWTSELKRAKDTFAQAEIPGFDVVPYGSGA